MRLSGVAEPAKLMRQLDQLIASVLHGQELNLAQHRLAPLLEAGHLELAPERGSSNHDLFMCFQKVGSTNPSRWDERVEASGTVETGDSGEILFTMTDFEILDDGQEWEEEENWKDDEDWGDEEKEEKF